MNKILIILILGVSSLFLGGCSWIGVGHNKTYCAEHGCDYSDAGVCGNSYDIYKNWRETEEKAYSGYACNKGADNE